MSYIFTDWNLIDYAEAWQKQQQIFDNLLHNKLHPEQPVEAVQQVILCEHPHVYTLGKNGNANNMLLNPEFLEKINAVYYHIDRGGDITYHGPGQLVGYPILDLEMFQLSLKSYIHQLEEAIIQTLAYYNIAGYRLDGATGVWLEPDKDTARKICAIGVRSSRYVTMHGFALNVNTDLSYFNYINPCGFVDKGVTSLQKELGYFVDMEEVKEVFKKCFSDNFLPVL